MRNESVVLDFKCLVVIVAKVDFLLLSSADMFVGWHPQLPAYDGLMFSTGGHLTTHLEHESFRVPPWWDVNLRGN